MAHTYTVDGLMHSTIRDACTTNNKRTYVHIQSIAIELESCMPWHVCDKSTGWPTYVCVYVASLPVLSVTEVMNVVN